MYNIEGTIWIKKYLGGIKGKSVVEFGNQHIWKPAMERFGIKYEIARDWYINDLGASRYECIDINKKDGALNINLTSEISDKSLLNQFDIVTNIGTLEHIGKSCEKQWNGFRNAVLLAKDGGLILHKLVPAGQWQDHCLVWYIDGIGKVLAENLDCELLEESRINLLTLNPEADYLCVALKKNKSVKIPKKPPDEFCDKLWTIL